MLISAVAVPVLFLFVLLSLASADAAPPHLTTQNAQGFAAPTQNLLEPLLLLAPSDQPLLALKTFEEIHDLDRKMMLHPVLSSGLQGLLDNLPAPEVIPVEMPSLYASSSIPWRSDPPDTRYLAIDGRPQATDYVYELSGDPAPPHQPGQLSTTFKIVPEPRDVAPPVRSVATELKILLYLSASLPPARGMEAELGFQCEIYGTLAPPWDKTPGAFNQHDQAALARLKRDLPATSERVEHYFEIHNLLDEFSGQSGPWVVFNLDAGIRESALAPFPHLRAFWGELERVDAQSVVRDEAGRPWLLAGLHRGRITLRFLLRDGMPAPMDSEMNPAGPALPIDQIRTGQFYTETTVSAERFGMRFGLAGIRFVTAYENRDGAIRLDGHMTDVPRLVAPRMIHPLTMLLAGEFLETVARGNGGGGLATSFSAQPGPQSGTMLSGSIGAQMRDAPALALLARMAAAFAPDYGAQVREEQRRLMAEFFNAFDSDYRRARPILLRVSTHPSSACGE